MAAATPVPVPRPTTTSTTTTAITTTCSVAATKSTTPITSQRGKTHEPIQLQDANKADFKAAASTILFAHVSAVSPDSSCVCRGLLSAPMLALSGRPDCIYSNLAEHESNNLFPFPRAISCADIRCASNVGHGNGKAKLVSTTFTGSLNFAPVDFFDNREMPIEFSTTHHRQQ